MALTVKISLVSAEDSSQLPSTQIGDKIYFHAEPETSFRVKYNVEYPAHVSPQHEKLLINLHIDGENVGYSKRVSPSLKSGEFEGFYKAVDNTRYKIFPFKFSGTVLADMRDQHTNSSSAGLQPEASGDKRGSIEIQLYEAYQDLNAAPRIFIPTAKGLPGGEVAIDKDKKFWTQPSATVGCDEAKSTVRNEKPTNPWLYRTNIPFLTSTFYYHTPNVIKILKMMRPKAEGEEAEDEAEEDESFVDPVPQTKTKVKEESSSSSSSSRKPKMPLESAGPVTISLVDDVAPAPAKKKAKQPSTTPIVIDLS